LLGEYRALPPNGGADPGAGARPPAKP